jgi:hypothetical protein
VRTAPVPARLLNVMPQLAAYAHTTARLHLRRHAVTAFDSHVGGRLRWPVDEPWRMCDTPLPGHADRKNPAAMRSGPQSETSS